MAWMHEDTSPAAIAVSRYGENIVHSSGVECGSDNVGYAFPRLAGCAGCGLYDLRRRRRSDCGGAGRPHYVCAAGGAIRQRTAIVATRAATESQEPAVVDLPRHCPFRQRG